MVLLVGGEEEPAPPKAPRFLFAYYGATPPVYFLTCATCQYAHRRFFLPTYRSLHRIYRAIAGAAPPADNNTAARGIRARIYLGESWPSKSPLPWLLGGPLQRARRSHVTCLALAGSVRARPAGGRWRAFFWHVAHSGIHFNRPQCRFGLKWLDLDHPRCPTCVSGAFLLDYVCV